MDKRLFIAVAKDQYYFRCHMMMILTATAICGLGISHLLLKAGMQNMITRFPVVTLMSYGVFLVWLKIWAWVMVCPPSSVDVGADPGGMADLIDGIVNYSCSRRPVTVSRSLVENIASIQTPNVSAGDAVDIAHAASDAAGAVGDLAGDVVGSADEGAIVIIPIIIVGTLLAVILGVGCSLVIDAPLILGETLFECCLGGGLFVGVRRWHKGRVSRPKNLFNEEALPDPATANWLWTAVGHTVKPFFLIAVLALFIGATAGAYSPGSQTLIEAYNGISAKGKMTAKATLRTQNGKPLAEALPARRQ